MSKVIDLSGKRFGKILVVEQTNERSSQGNAMWLCKCDCGNSFTSYKAAIDSKRVKSCNKCSKKTCHVHGMYKDREFKIWVHMKQRCFNKNHARYRDYGGRGISMCEAWKSSFLTFFADMGKCPSPAHSIERTNVEGDYNAENCYWATNDIQQNNKRSNVYYEYNGKVMSQAQWTRVLGFKEPSSIIRKMKAGCTFAQIVEIYKIKNGISIS